MLITYITIVIIKLYKKRLQVYVLQIIGFESE